MGAISDKTLGSDCLKLHLMLQKQSKFENNITWSAGLCSAYNICNGATLVIYRTTTSNFVVAHQVALQNKI